MKKYHCLYIIILVGIFAILSFTLYERLFLKPSIQFKGYQVNNRVYERTPFKVVKNTNILI